MSSSMLLVVILVIASSSVSLGIRPIIIIPGILDDESALVAIKNFIYTEYPDAEISTVPEFFGAKSLTNLWGQIEGTYELIQPILESAPNGVIMIGYSQGGVVCRGIIQNYPDHNVHTFISVGTPLMGIYGVPENVETLFPFLEFVPYPEDEDMYKLAYTDLGQLVSLGNLWNDPYHQLAYNRKNVFLPVLNNAANQHDNFKPVEQLVLIGSPDDGFIIPWESCFFGFYKNNDASTIVPMKMQKVYLNDVFGLQTLDKAGKIFRCVVTDVTHGALISTEAVFTTCINPWLE